MRIKIFERVEPLTERFTSLYIYFYGTKINLRDTKYVVAFGLSLAILVVQFGGPLLIKCSSNSSIIELSFRVSRLCKRLLFGTVCSS